MATEALALPAMKMQLAAKDPAQMEGCRKYLIEWFERRISEELTSADEIGAAYESALKHKWAVKALRNQLNKSAKRVSFYQKCKAAVEAGFTLVPNFPIDLFAIRVDKSRPTPQSESNTGSWYPNLRDEQPKQLAQGEGKYVNPSPQTTHWDSTEKNSRGEEIIRYHTDTWGEFRDVDFPVTVAHPIVMDAAAQAMGLKLFDSIGICQDVQASRRAGRRRGDPLVIGRIYMPKTSGYGDQKCISFLIAWHVDLRGL